MDDKRDSLREGIDAADDTGLIAGEQLITQAETLLPLEAPALPREDLHAALPQDHRAHATIDDLHGQMGAERPDRQAIERHVDHLRAIPELEATLATWWEDPKTQRFISILGQI